MYMYRFTAILISTYCPARNYKNCILIQYNKENYHSKQEKYIYKPLLLLLPAAATTLLVSMDSAGQFDYGRKSTLFSKICSRVTF